jgi:hypothetical protein
VRLDEGRSRCSLRAGFQGFLASLLAVAMLPASILLGLLLCD